MEDEQLIDQNSNEPRLLFERQDHPTMQFQIQEIKIDGTIATIEDAFKVDAAKRIIKNIQKDNIKNGQELFEKVQSKQKLSTGMHELDFKLNNGLARNKIYEIQGSSGMGKTTLLDKIVAGVLSQQCGDNSKVVI